MTMHHCKHDGHCGIHCFLSIIGIYFAAIDQNICMAHLSEMIWKQGTEFIWAYQKVRGRSCSKLTIAEAKESLRRSSGYYGFHSNTREMCHNDVGLTSMKTSAVESKYNKGQEDAYAALTVLKLVVTIQDTTEENFCWSLWSSWERL